MSTFIWLAAFLWSNRVEAAWPELAELTSAALGHRCATAPAPGPEDAPAAELREKTAFRQIAGLRSEDFGCGSALGRKLVENPAHWEQLSRQMVDSVFEIAEARRNLVALFQREQKIVNPANQPAPEISTASASDQRQQLMEMIGASYASIPMSDHPAVAKVVGEFVNKMNASAQARVRERKSVHFDEPNDPVDAEDLKRKLRSAIQVASRDYQNSKLAIDKKLADPKYNPSTTEREELARDHSLMERWRKKSQIRDDQVCRLNQRYGEGANRRDNTLVGVSVVSALLSGGMTAYGQALVKSGSAAMTATRVAQARGILTASAARVFGTVSHASSLASLYRGYQTNCTNSVNPVGSGEGDVCSDFTPQSALNAGCAASVVFSGLYLRAASPAIKSLLQRSLQRRGYSTSMQPLSTPAQTGPGTLAND